MTAERVLDLLRAMFADRDGWRVHLAPLRDALEAYDAEHQWAGKHGRPGCTARHSETFCCTRTAGHDGAHRSKWLDGNQRRSWR